MWNNPSCSKCAAARETPASLAVGPVRMRAYLQEPPTPRELEDVLTRLNKEPWDICRLNEPIATEIGIAQWGRDAETRSAWIEAMTRNPALIQRPIIIFDDGSAIVARDATELAARLQGNE